MQFSDADLDELIAGYAADTGETLSRVEALEAAIRLMAFFELLASDPDPNNEVQDPGDQL